MLPSIPRAQNDGQDVARLVAYLETLTREELERFRQAVYDCHPELRERVA